MKTNSNKAKVKVEQLAINFDLSINSNKSFSTPEARVILFDSFSNKAEKDFSSLVISQSKSF